MYILCIHIYRERDIEREIPIYMYEIRHKNKEDLDQDQSYVTKRAYDDRAWDLLQGVPTFRHYALSPYALICEL